LEKRHGPPHESLIEMRPSLFGLRKKL